MADHAPRPWVDLPAYRVAYRARNPLPASAPPLLAALPQWLVWRYEPGETPEKKPRKMPYYARGHKRHGGKGSQGSEPDRRALVTFADARAAAAAGDYDGVGFAFLPGDGLIGIDLDGMVDPATGEVSERLTAIVDACATYTEASPSGMGVHIIGAVTADTVEAFKEEGRRLTFKSNAVGVEVFHGSQFFTWTGRAWGTAPAEVQEIPLAVLRRLYATVKGPRPAAPAASAVPAAAPQGAVVGGRKRSLAETVALAEQAIACLKPDEYAQWIKLGMALKELGAAGYMIWDTWSAGSPKYAGGEDTARRWAGFNPTDIHLGTLFALAEDEGWVSPWAQAAERKARKRGASAPAAGAASSPPAAPAAEPPPGAESLSPPTAPAGGGEGPPPDAGGGGDDDEPPDDWTRQLLQKKGEISPCLANAELVLSCMREWRGVIGYDEFSERTVFRRRPPCEQRGPMEGEWSDQLDITAAIWLQRKWGVEFSDSTVGKAVEVQARRHRFHPVRDALGTLRPWDGVRRNSEWLSDYLGVKRTEYTGLVGQFFLRGMVKRVMEPGCKFDYCLVLEGEQGRGKSTAARILAWHWFADTDLDLSNKDSLMALPGKWVYEIAEMGSLMKAEERKQKSFLSRQEDEYRPPYGKRLIKAPRQCVFIGTTNEEEYLKDATGGRRFWPVLCEGEFDLDGLRAALEQMLAEALHDYYEGARCWPTPDEQQQLFTPEQAKRGMPEPFEDYLYKWVNEQVAPFSMAEVAAGPLNLTPDKLTPAVVTRIGMALRKLGCARIEDRLSPDPGRRRLYLPPKMSKSDIRANPRAARDLGPDDEEFPYVPF